jgi:hypothetical protein
VRLMRPAAKKENNYRRKRKAKEAIPDVNEEI